MAVTRVPDYTRVILTLDNGIDEAGKLMTASKTVNGIKAEAADQDVYDIISQLAALQTHNVVAIDRVDREELTV